jgi:aspartyl protease
VTAAQWLRLLMRRVKTLGRAPARLLLASLLGVTQSSSQITRMDSAVVEVPMLLLGPMPAIEVMVNGQGPFVFAIDTGATGMARADSSLVERLKLPTVGRMRGGDGSGRSRSMEVVRLDSITFGGLRFENVRAPTRDYRTYPHLSGVDGILGFDLFSEFLLTLDYAGRRVRLERGRLPEPDGAEVLGYEAGSGPPAVEIGVGSFKLRGRFDTGNAIGAFILPESLVQRLSFASPPVAAGTGSTLSSRVELRAARLKDTIRLGRFEFAEPRVIFPALTDEANIGSEAFRDFAITFDQQNRRLRLRKRS